MKTLFDSVDAMQSAMTFHRERHTLLAGNLANLDTPGYQPLDLERAAPDAPAAGVELARTDAHHLTTGTAPDGAKTFVDAGAQAGADGNAVNLEREMAKIAANRVRYATTSELVTRRLALIRYAATDGNG